MDKDKANDADTSCYKFSFNCNYLYVKLIIKIINGQMEKMIPLVTNFKKIPSNSIICKLTWINDNYFNFMVRYGQIQIDRGANDTSCYKFFKNSIESFQIQLSAKNNDKLITLG